MNASYPTTIPPCPPWCVLPAGHEYELTSAEDPEQFLRYHSSVPDDHVIADVYVRVEALEVNLRGLVLVDQPSAAIFDTEARTLSPEECRRYAQSLLEAADHVEALLRDQA